MSLKIAWLVGALLVGACQNLPENRTEATIAPQNPETARASKGKDVQPAEVRQRPVFHPHSRTAEGTNTEPAIPADTETSRGIQAVPTKPGPGQDHFLI